MELLLGPDSDQMAAIANELGEDPARLEHNLQLFMRWISCQAYLPKDIDERLLPVFLRGCKHDLERAKKKLEVYYTARRTSPEIYASRDPLDTDLQFAARLLYMVPLPTLTADGYRVTVKKLMGTDASLFDIEHIIKHGIMMADVRVHEEKAIAGDVYIIDFANNLSLGHCAKVAGAFQLRKVFALATEAYPQRVKAIHIVNAPTFVDRLLVAMRAFMKEKVRRRFVVHEEMSSLLEHVPANLLPPEYGGTAPQCLEELHTLWQNHLVDHSSWFSRQEHVHATAAVPPPAHCHVQNATEGSFRHLTID